MSEAGYTLTEVVIAVAILSLTIGGLTQAMYVVGGSEGVTARRIREDQNRREMSNALEAVFATVGPFRSKDAASLVGDASTFKFPCEADQVCGATLTPEGEGALLQVQEPGSAQALIFPIARGGVHFQFHGTLTTQAFWPPGGNAAQMLNAITLTRDATGDVVAETKLWVEEDPACQFDAVMKDCRGVAT